MYLIIRLHPGWGVDPNYITQTTRFFFIAEILGTWMPGTSCARPTKENIFTTSAHRLKNGARDGWVVQEGARRSSTGGRLP